MKYCKRLKSERHLTPSLRPPLVPLILDHTRVRALFHRLWLLTWIKIVVNNYGKQEFIIRTWLCVYCIDIFFNLIKSRFIRPKDYWKIFYIISKIVHTLVNFKCPSGTLFVSVTITIWSGKSNLDASRWLRLFQMLEIKIAWFSWSWRRRKVHAPPINRFWPVWI